MLTVVPARRSIAAHKTAALVFGSLVHVHVKTYRRINKWKMSVGPDACRHELQKLSKLTDHSGAIRRSGRKVQQYVGTTTHVHKLITGLEICAFVWKAKKRVCNGDHFDGELQCPSKKFKATELQMAKSISCNSSRAEIHLRRFLIFRKEGNSRFLELFGLSSWTGCSPLSVPGPPQTNTSFLFTHTLFPDCVCSAATDP